jgi:hypothetical protein
MMGSLTDVVLAKRIDALTMMSMSNDQNQLKANHTEMLMKRLTFIATRYFRSIACQFPAISPLL